MAESGGLWGEVVGIPEDPRFPLKFNAQEIPGFRIAQLPQGDYLCLRFCDEGRKSRHS